MTDFVVAIPARYDASRLPGKPLRLLGGDKTQLGKASDLIRREAIGTGNGDMTEDLDGAARQVLIAHLRVVAGVLLRGDRVVVAAHRVEGDRDLESRARRRALEGHVFEEVRKAAFAIGFLKRARSDPHPQFTRETL